MDNLDYYMIKELIIDVVGPEMSSISDCAYHGVASGCGGEFIYTYKCLGFYNAYKTALWRMICDGADEMGKKPLEFIASLQGCEVSDHDSLATIIVWYCVEYVCRRIDDEASECSYCGEKYIDTGADYQNSGYCSEKCYDEDNKLETCEYCNTEYGNNSYYPFCSYNCCRAYAIENDTKDSDND